MHFQWFPKVTANLANYLMAYEKAIASTRQSGPAADTREKENDQQEEGHQDSQEQGQQDWQSQSNVNRGGLYRCRPSRLRHPVATSMLRHPGATPVLRHPVATSMLRHHVATSRMRHSVAWSTKPSGHARYQGLASHRVGSACKRGGPTRSSFCSSRSIKSICTSCTCKTTSTPTTWLQIAFFVLNSEGQ